MENFDDEYLQDIIASLTASEKENESPEREYITSLLEPILSETSRKNSNYYFAYFNPILLLTKDYISYFYDKANSRLNTLCKNIANDALGDNEDKDSREINMRYVECPFDGLEGRPSLSFIEFSLSLNKIYFDDFERNAFNLATLVYAIILDIDTDVSKRMRQNCINIIVYLWNKVNIFTTLF